MKGNKPVNDLLKFDSKKVHKYKLILRGDRLLGFWAGEQLGEIDCEILDHMTSFVQVDLE